MTNPEAAGANSDELTIGAVIDRVMTERPQDVLLAMEGLRLTWREADARSAELARALLASRVGKGTRVGLLFPNGPAFLIAFLAVTRIGAVACPFSTFLKPAEIATQLRHSDVQVLLTAAAFQGNDYLDTLGLALDLADDASPALTCPAAPFLREIIVDAASKPAWATALNDVLVRAAGIDPQMLAIAQGCVVPADLLCLLYTSGSTAAPKGVLHSQGAFIRRSLSIGRDFGYGPGTVVYGPMPFFWLGGLSTLLATLLCGGTALAQERFRPAETLALLARERATHVIGWPHFAESMRRDPAFAQADLGSVRGGNLHPLLFGPPRIPSHFADGIGMTETAGQHCFRDTTPLPSHLHGATGKLSADMDHRIVDPHSGHVLEEGAHGELQVRGYSVMQGYYKREREEAFEPDGFFRTGDLGCIREGYFFFSGRLGDMIKTGGSNVSPREVEDTLRTVPGVAECYVLGLEDHERGQIVAAAIVPAPGAELSQALILAALKPQLSAFKLPKVVALLGAAEIPKLPTGKLDQRSLKAILAEHT